MAALLSGCGAGGTSPVTKDAHAESTACIGCHQDPSWKTPDTGLNVVDEWKRSTHNTNNGASCGDCHGTGANHPASCNKCHSTSVAFNPIKNPDSAGKCAVCHNLSNTNNSFSKNREINGLVATDTLSEHFSDPTQKTYTSGKYFARYVTKNYEGKCRRCHNPHDTSSQMKILRQWARSGKGDVEALPWAYYDFGRDPARSTATPDATPANSFGADCVRCHTASGYINYLTNKSIKPVYAGTSKTDGKETLACNACHTNYSYARRPVGPITAYYNKSTVSNMRIRIAVTYPDIGESNLCLNCHVGRENGKIIKELATQTNPNGFKVPGTTPQAYNFGNAGFENSHYLTAGATIFRTSGFEFYSSQYYNNPSFYEHDVIGVGNLNNTGTSGPCITCHMKPGNHTFLPVKKSSRDKLTAVATELTSTICANCHTGNYVMSAEVINHEREGFHASLETLRILLENKLLVYFATSSPYFFKIPNTIDATLAARNWLQHPDPKATGDQNMGAAFNYNLLHHDYGAFAHNRYYAKRLIYDSIRYLANPDLKTPKSMPLYYSDVEAAIQNSPLTAEQKKAACEYLFNINTGDYTYSYSVGNWQNWRPGSSYLNPLY
jgi:hypothetical protein